MKKIKKGFTIVELLVVMSIIIIFMGFLLPRISGYRNKAKDLKIRNYARQLYTATMASYAENDGEFIKSEIDKSIKELLSINDKQKNKINVESGKNGATISFSMENKDYYVQIDNNGYKLLDKKE